MDRRVVRTIYINQQVLFVLFALNLPDLFTKHRVRIGAKQWDAVCHKMKEKIVKPFFFLTDSVHEKHKCVEI